MMMRQRPRTKIFPEKHVNEGRRPTPSQQISHICRTKATRRRLTTGRQQALASPTFRIPSSRVASSHMIYPGTYLISSIVNFTMVASL